MQETLNVKFFLLQS